jgi:transcriptional regulator with XRE-family HTH domain
MSANEYPKSLLEARTLSGRSQLEVADVLGLTRAAVGHWETGVAIPEPPSRRLLAQLFEVPLEVVEAWPWGPALRSKEAA